MPLLHTVHPVAFNKALVLLVDSRLPGSSGQGPNVVVQIPAQVLIKHSGQEVELFVIVFLHEEKREERGGQFSVSLHAIPLLELSFLPQ